MLAFNSQVFNQKYGNFFIATHPNYKLEVISLKDFLSPDQNYYQSLENAIALEQPDVLSISMEHYAIFRERSKLRPLNHWMKRDGFDIEGITPAIIDSLQNEAGDLNGLSPVFTGSALYINKKMLAESGIPVPTDSLTWDQVFQLAQQVKPDNKQVRQYGLYTKYAANPYMMALYVGEGSGLHFFNHGNEHFTFDAPGWENVFQNIVDCFQAQVCYDNHSKASKRSMTREESEVRSYPFLAGNIALAVDDSALYRILTASKDRYNDLEWTVVPSPTSSQYPTTGNGIRMEEIFAIPAGAKHADDAWELVKYICGDDYGKLLPHINPDDLPAREATDEEGLAEVFYKLDHVNNNRINGLRRLPDPVLKKMEEVSASYIAHMLEQNMPVRDALHQMQHALQTAWDNSTNPG
ncbi:periplasmic component [Paenibacillus popilliae ATCC 14706]|uniref:Periplasmic component n=1 Tax=Paenibacillus popilliae ATCC 14706 TaxID=1212764 RepID=M9LCJ6_PAEPP|nr:periplasmic component [Paenibacillus popilliae ATCC 14706]